MVSFIKRSRILKEGLDSQERTRWKGEKEKGKMREWRKDRIKRGNDKRRVTDSRVRECKKGCKTLKKGGRGKARREEKHQRRRKEGGGIGNGMKNIGRREEEERKGRRGGRVDKEESEI